LYVPAGTTFSEDIKQTHNLPEIAPYQEVLQERAISIPEEFYCTDTILTDDWKFDISKFDDLHMICSL
jgi:hypothetical protein